MYGLTKKQKVNFILEKVAEFELTAYDIGKKIEMSPSGIEKILKGIVTNPQEKTLNKIMEYLEKKVLGSELSTKNDEIKEPEENYLSQKTMDELEKNPLVKCLNEQIKLTKEISRLKEILNDNNIKF